MENKNQANVFDVAKYILHKLRKITTFKLQKLCYYSYVWTLVWDEEHLFNEKIYAWKNGPVIPDLYEKHKGIVIFGHNDSVFFVRKTENYNHKFVKTSFADYKNWHKNEFDKLTESEKCRKFIEWSTYFEVSRNENGKIRWR